MKLSNYFNRDFCIMELRALNKEDAIREIALALNHSGKVKNFDKFVSDVLERESLGSTGIGHNVAIPHARTDAVEGFLIGFGRSTKGIDFKALDGEKVNLIFLMGANPSELNLYLRMLAELSKFLMEHSFRKMLIYSTSADEVIDILRKFEEI